MAVLAVHFLRTGGIAMLKEMEVAPERLEQGRRDPVCGMTVDPESAAERVEHDGRPYAFCSAGCRTAFDREPRRYTANEEVNASMHHATPTESRGR